NYRMVLTPEGLTAFVGASFSKGRPGIADLQALDYRTRSVLVESGMSYPFIRQRERNLTLTGLIFASDDRSDTNGATPLTLDRQAAAGVGIVRLWRPCLRPRLRPLAAGRRPLPGTVGRAAARCAPFVPGPHSGAALCLRRPGLAP